MRKRIFRPARRGWRVIAIAGMLFVAVLAAGATILQRQTPLRIDANDGAQVALGQNLYAAACASCHGAALEGQPNWQRRLANGRLPAPPHDASGHTWHHADAFLIRVTQLGPAAYPQGYATDMPAFGDTLSVQQIAAILAFIKSKWPPDIRAQQNRLNVAR